MWAFWISVTLFVCAFAVEDYGPQIIVSDTTTSLPLGDVQKYMTKSLPSSCSNFFNIAAMMTVPWYEKATNANYSGEFQFQGTNTILGWWLWQEMRNEAGGIDVNGTRYCINLTIVSCGYTIDSVTTTAQNIVNGKYGYFHVAFAPWSSGLCSAVAPIFDAANMPLISGFATAIGIYRCNPHPPYQSYCTNIAPGKRSFQNVFSILAESKLMYAPLFNVLKIAGARSFAGFASNETFVLDLLNGSATVANEYGLTVASDSTFVIGIYPTTDELSQSVTKLKQINADVVLAGTRFVSDCITFIKELKKQNYMPPALLLSQCLDDPRTVATLGKDSAFIIDYITWHEGFPGAGFSDDSTKLFPENINSSSSKLFFDSFINRWGVSPDHMSAPVSLVMGYVIENILENSENNITREYITQQLNVLQDTNFWGNVRFDSYGMNYVKSYISTQLNRNLSMDLIAPMDVANKFIQYPAPTWDDRIWNPQFIGTATEKVIFSLSILGIIFTLCCGIWISLNATRAAVKAAQPPFLGLMLVGSGFLYVAVICWSLWMNTGLCIARNWMLSLGFTIVYGTLVARSHRVKSVFVINRFDKVKVVTDYGMLKIIGAILAVNIVILILWTSLSQQSAQTVMTDPDRPAKNFVTCSFNIIDIVFVCILAAFKLTIVVYGLYLSILLWKHRKSIYIESRQIVFCFYNLAVFGLLFVILQATMDPVPETRTVLYVLRSACIFISNISTILTLLWRRFLQPDKGEGGTNNTSGSAHHSSSVVASAAGPSDAVKLLQQERDNLREENKSLKAKLTKYQPTAVASDDD